MNRIRKGLDIPLLGVPEQAISEGNPVRHVALLGADYLGMKPTMEVREGDRVKLGQRVFEDKKTPGVIFTAPAGGRVAAIQRGSKRRFEALVIEVDGEEEEEEETFPSFADQDLQGLRREQVRDTLVAAGMWTALRTRPFSKIPSPESEPHSIFVTATDTNPLAADPALIISEASEHFTFGLQALRRLTPGTVYVCRRAGSSVPGDQVEGVQVAVFDGPHPAGLAGTHIHFLDPVGPRKTVWYVNYQDVIAIGRLFQTGRLAGERVVSLAGPAVSRPRLVRTRLGANLSELTAGELGSEALRVISGSVLCGRAGHPPLDFLGRYHLQVSVLTEGGQREFLGWNQPGFDKFSVKNAFASALMRGGKRFPLDTSVQGSPRAMVPIGMYEHVMPLDILPTQLLRALIVGDAEQAQALGCLELDEEDLGLCTFVCPGKYDYGTLLRENLTLIEREG